MIAKFILNSNDDCFGTLICECDQVVISNNIHSKGCDCSQCKTFNTKEQTVVKEVHCFKTKKAMPSLPEGLAAENFELIRKVPLSIDDFCYVLNDDGKTIDKITGTTPTFNLPKSYFGKDNSITG